MKKEKDHASKLIAKVKESMYAEIEIETIRINMIEEASPRTCCGFCNKKKIPKKWIIPYKSKNKRYWDLGILALAIYKSFSVPMEQCFKPIEQIPMIMDILDFVIDLLWLADIIVGFFTTVVDKRGKESFDSKLIAHRLTHSSRFYIDCLSMLEAFSHFHRYFKPFGLLRIQRVLLINDFIIKANADEVTKALMSLAKITFFLLFYLHCLACYLWLTLSFNAPEMYHLQSEDGVYKS